MISEPLDLVRGRGRFVDDALPPGTMYAEFVRSAIPHGRLLDVDVEAAASLPGIVAVHTAATLGAPAIPSQPRPSAPAIRGMDRPTLARDRVRYAGEAVAVVLAERPEGARDAAELVWPEIDPLPTVVDPVVALRDETLLFPEAGTNLALQTATGPDGPEPDGPVVVERWIRHARLAPVPIEPLGIVAVPEDNGVTVWCGHQRPHLLRSDLRRAFSSSAGIEVRVPDVGGAFGSKGQMYPEYVAVVAAALLHQRPVLWRERRREHFSNGTQGRGLVHRVRLAGDGSGKILALTIDILGDLGAYPQQGHMVPGRAAMIGAGPYVVDFVRVTMKSVVTNTAPTGPYRGAGRPEAATALESIVDAYARRIGRDPLDVRRRNLVPVEAMPFTTATDVVYDGGDYRAALDMAAELVDVTEARARQRNRRHADRGDPVGVGVAAFVDPAGGRGSSAEYSKVEIERDGTISVRTGSTSAGQSHARVWRRLVADLFDTDPASIRFFAGDTRQVPEGGGTFGSRSTQLGAVAAVRTGRRVLRAATMVAAGLLEAAPEDVRAVGGGFAVAGTPDSRVELRTVAEHAAELGVELASEETYSAGAETWPYGAHAAVVEVSRETGEVRVVRVAAVDDCGEVLDPPSVLGQLYGGLTQGLGQALFEEVRYREDGQLLTGSLMDYPLPRAVDVPPIVLGKLTTPSSNELGVKGVGESGVIGLPVAVLIAVLDALGDDAVEDLDLPLKPDRVWEALRRSSIAD
jgi:carbon-monoxide dehydrogenase large subunit